jgi:hypothetical protein
MYRYISLGIVSAAVLLGVTPVSAATQAIGVAMSEGTILVNDAQTPGNTTIFSGSTLQTQSASSQVRMKDGAQVRFDSDSRGKLFSDHVDLQQGTARISAYSANANGLSVRAAGDSTASVSIKGNVIEVAALAGDVHVFNAAGMNVANLLPGRALDLRPQDAGASSPSSLIGCAVKSGNNYVLTDETSQVTAQLRGGKITAGKRIQITGSLVPNATPVSPATQVIAVTSVKEVGGTCAPGAGAPGSAAGAGAAAAGSGVGIGAGLSTAAIVGVTVAAAAAAGLGIAYGSGAIGGSPAVVPCVPTSAQPCPI